MVPHARSVASSIGIRAVVVGLPRLGVEIAPTGAITNIVRKSARPMMTGFGGRSLSERARRTNESTITMRVKLVSVMTPRGAGSGP